MSSPQLNEPQTQAVRHVAGPLLVFAGAGSGKTRTITYRIAHLLANENVPPYRILAVTFTNKAAGEMRARIEQLVGAELARDLWVGTFHSVAERLLRRYCSEVHPRYGGNARQDQEYAGVYHSLGRFFGGK